MSLFSHPSVQIYPKWLHSNHIQRIEYIYTKKKEERILLKQHSVFFCCTFSCALVLVKLACRLCNSLHVSHTHTHRTYHIYSYKFNMGKYEKMALCRFLLSNRGMGIHILRYIYTHCCSCRCVLVFVILVYSLYRSWVV